MGDFADMALSETMDMEDLRFEYRMGGMSDFDAYDHGIIDERGAYLQPTPVAKTCRHCGAKGLWWLPLKRGEYRLMNPGGTQHNCQRVPASIDEFEVCAPRPSGI